MTINRWTSLSVCLSLFAACMVGDPQDASPADDNSDGHPEFGSLALSATAVSSTQIRVTWRANTESDLAGYRVYRNGVVIATLRKSYTTYTDTGLLPAVTYNYNITAFDIAGNESGFSATLTATTYPATMSTVSFSRTVWPILRSYCSGCHAAQSQVATSYTRMTSTISGGACNGLRMSIPGNPLASLSFQKVTGSQHCGGVMPPSGPLSSSQASIIGAWITQGARNN